MSILVVGLGNPGDNYTNTPHNAGYIFLDLLKSILLNNTSLHTTHSIKEAKTYTAELFEIFNTKKNLSDLSKRKYLTLLKPLVFMNQSGQAVSDYIDYYKISPASIFIAFDDLDIPYGQYKIQNSRYPKTHNGVNSTLSSIQKRNFSLSNLYSVRIGID